MRSFETTPEFEERIVSALSARKFPAQVIFGQFDPALPPAPFAEYACDILKLNNFFLVPGKHFLQEDCWDPIAAHIRDIVSSKQDRAPV